MTSTTASTAQIVTRRTSRGTREQEPTAAQKAELNARNAFQKAAFDAHARGEPVEVWRKPSPEGWEVLIWYVVDGKPYPLESTTVRIKRAKRKPGEDRRNTSRQSRRSYSFGTDGTAPATNPTDPDPDPFAQIAQELGATERRRGKRVYTFGTG